MTLLLNEMYVNCKDTTDPGGTTGELSLRHIYARASTVKCCGEEVLVMPWLAVRCSKATILW